MKEVKKKDWSRFCREMSEKHRFSKTEVVRLAPDWSETVTSSAPLLGVSLSRERRKSLSFEVTLGQIRNGSPASTVALIGAPERILHGSWEDGVEIVEVHNEDGYRMILKILAGSGEESYGLLVKEMAYVLAEVRGFAPGYDQEDWFLAERLVRKAAMLQA